MEKITSEDDSECLLKLRVTAVIEAEGRLGQSIRELENKVRRAVEESAKMDQRTVDCEAVSRSEVMSEEVRMNLLAISCHLHKENTVVLSQEFSYLTRRLDKIIIINPSEI